MIDNIVEIALETDNDDETLALEEQQVQIDEMLLNAQAEAEKIISDARLHAKKEADEIKASVLFEQGRLKEQEIFFEKKMDILKAGFAQLESDKKAFEREKRIELENRAKANSYAGPGDTATMLFAGVNNILAVKKRYKDLIKIFHPDNLCGDTEVLQLINKEYEKLQDEFGWIRKAY